MKHLLCDNLVWLRCWKRGQSIGSLKTSNRPLFIKRAIKITLNTRVTLVHKKPQFHFHSTFQTAERPIYVRHPFSFPYLPWCFYQLLSEMYHFPPVKEVRQDAAHLVSFHFGWVWGMNNARFYVPWGQHFCVTSVTLPKALPR